MQGLQIFQMGFQVNANEVRDACITPILEKGGDLFEGRVIYAFDSATPHAMTHRVNSFQAEIDLEHLSI